jgi:hypothetical protein
MADRATGVTPLVAAGRHVYLFAGAITATDADGHVAWAYGGLDYLGAGVSFFRGTVTSDGTIYTLGAERGTGRDGTYVFALRPAIRP